MADGNFRNTWIICRHECLKRIRTRSFLITTFLMPGFLALIVGIPALLGAQARRDTQRITLACPRTDLAEMIRERLAVNTKGTYHVTIDTDVSEAEHQRLLDDLKERRIDGL